MTAAVTASSLALGTMCPASNITTCGHSVAGTILAHAMFDLPVLQWSTKVRAGSGQWIAEGVATCGLLLVILRAPAGAGPDWLFLV